MTFDVDRTSVTEGDVVEVKWDCSGADRVELKIDNGYKASVIPLEITGAKRFRLNRSKGRTALTITAWKDGKHGSKTIRVRVTEMPTTHAETVDNQGHSTGAVRQWWQRIQPQWQSMPTDKRLAFTVLLILGVILLLCLAAPRLLSIGLLALMVYLVYVIRKK